MDKYLAAYRSQKSGAKARGIEFRLTFAQWLEFWGSDIDKRGVGPDKLQMQRFGDQGAYELGNIKKGYPKQNSATMGAVKRMRNTMKAAERLQEEIDRQPASEADDEWQEEEDGLAELGYASSLDRRFAFAADSPY